MVGNPVTNTLHYLLEDRWKGDRVYVVGDYANVFDKRESNFFCKKLKELADKLECEVAEVPDAEVQALFESIGVKYSFSIEPWYMSFVKLMNEIPGLERPKTRNDQYVKTLYSCCNDEDDSGFTGIGATIPQEVLENYKRPRYLCNAATKEYIDTKALPIAWSYDMAEEKREEFEKAGLAGKVWQYFTVVPDFKSTGIKDGKRAFEWLCIVRAINTTDVVQVTVEPIDYDLMCRITDRITHEVPGINRVLYDYTPKPTATVEYE